MDTIWRSSGTAVFSSICHLRCSEQVAVDHIMDEVKLRNRKVG